MTPHTPSYLRSRAALRRALHGPIVYTDGVFCASGTVVNFTAIGLCLDGIQPVQVGMTLIVFFIAPAQTASLLIRRGTVRWTQGKRFGMTLTDVSPETYSELSRLAVTHLPTVWSGLN